MRTPCTRTCIEACAQGMHGPRASHATRLPHTPTPAAVLCQRTAHCALPLPRAHQPEVMSHDHAPATPRAHQAVLRQRAHVGHDEAVAQGLLDGIVGGAGRELQAVARRAVPHLRVVGDKDVRLTSIIVRGGAAWLEHGVGWARPACACLRGRRGGVRVRGGGAKGGRCVRVVGAATVVAQQTFFIPNTLGHPAQPGAAFNATQVGWRPRTHAP